jgi:hypothetical protein
MATPLPVPRSGCVWAIVDSIVEVDEVRFTADDGSRWRESFAFP